MYLDDEYRNWVLDPVKDEVATYPQAFDGSPQQLSHLAEFTRNKSQYDPNAVQEESPQGQMYKPLSKHDDKEIRTLELYSGSFDEPLRGKLHHCTLDFEYPKEFISATFWYKQYTNHAMSSQDGKTLFYTALSYTWGPPEYDRVIECNGYAKQVTRTLDIALRHFRSPTESIMLWVDQICINQTDAAEKARQVPLMALIYRRAFNTLIWLGAEPSNGAFALLRSIQGILGEFALDEQEDHVFESFLALDFPSGFGAEVAWRALQKLFSRWYFKRTWVIQEAVLSNYSIARCGPDKMTWNELTTCAMTTIDSGFYKWLGRQVRAEVSEIAPGCQVARDLGLQKFSLGPFGEDKRFLINALEECRYAEYSEPRDKVYGVLGLCNVEIQPDYTKPVPEVYLDATCTAMREHPLRTNYRASTSSTAHFHDWYRFLSCVDHPPSTDGRPSWVPDWSQPRCSEALAFDSGSLDAYNAGDWYRNETFDLSDDGMVMSVPGKVFNRIASLKEPIHNSSLTHEPGNNAWLHKLSKEVAAILPYPNGDNAEEVLTQLCVAGKNQTGKRRSPPDFRTKIGKLLRTEEPHQYRQQVRPHAVELQSTKSKKQKKVRPPGQRRSDALQDLRLACANALTQRRLGILSNRYAGLVPRYAEEGDAVVVFAGAAIPFVIRHVEDDKYQLIGESYVHGIMRGEIQSLNIEDTLIKLV